tara:strand:+ start:5660 stop:8146 length:2487 start_codon:yes stop_codon:yes gene_type:complete
MAMNLDTTFKLKAKVEGGRTVTQFKKQLRGLETSSKMSKTQLGKMNIEINRMARAAGNTTRGLKQHISALQNLRSRTEIGSKAYKRLGGEIDRLKGKLKGLDSQADKTGSKIATLVAGIGFGRAIKGTISTASSYDEELRKAAAIEGKGANFGQIKTAVESTASVAAGTPQEVAELATVLSRAGFSADKITNSLTGIVRGAEATGVGFAEMGSVVSDNLNAFGLEAEKTGALTDVLVTAANSSNQSVSDLGEALKYSAPAAKTYGVTVNDLAASISLMAQSGIRGSMAGTGLSVALGNLQKAAGASKGELFGLSRGSERMGKAMKKIGSEVTDSSGKLKPMDQIILSLKKNMAGFNDAQKTELTEALFGKEAGRKFLAMTNQSEEAIKNMFETIRESGGSTAETHAAMASFGREMKVLGGNFQVVTNQIGGAFMVVLNPLAKSLNALIAASQKLPGPVKRFAGAMAAAGLAAGVLKTTIVLVKGNMIAMMIVGKVATLFGGLTKALGLAKAAMVAFNLTNPLGWIALAVGATAALITNFNGIRDWIVEIGLVIRNHILGVWNALPAVIRKFFTGSGATIEIPAVRDSEGNVLHAGTDKIAAAEIDKTNILGGKGSGEATGLEGEPQKTKSILNSMKEGWDEYKAKITDTGEMVKSAMGTSLQALEDMFTNFFNTGKLAWQEFTRTILLEIQKIVIRKAIIAPIMGGLETTFPKIFGANGIAFGANGIVPYRKGGVINSPTMFKYGGSNLGVMGEAGPESIMPLKRGSDGKLGVISHGGKGTNVVVNVDASGSSVQGDDQNAAELGRMLSSAIEQKLIEAQQPGGLLYS